MGRMIMAQIHAIRVLHADGKSQRQIAAMLGIDRKTVAKHLKDESGKQAGSSKGSQSSCMPYQQLVEEKLGKGLSVQRIYQDLKAETDFPQGYDAVKRFVRGLKEQQTKVCARIETSPGYEAQVDFGQGALTKKGDKYRRPHLFVMTLSYSRHAYQEAVWHQDVETFIRCHEHAFAFFGGVPKVMLLDNLKAGVLKAYLFEPKLNPLYESFAHHATFTPLPCLVRRPEHKGKVEAGVKYAQDNALKGRRFESIEEQNRYLKDWNRRIAFPRRHGTTKQIVSRRFEEEIPHLRPLPTGEFVTFKIGIRRVHVDAHVEVEGAYYSVPHRLLGQDVVVHHNGKWVKVFFKDELLVSHSTAQPGSFRTRNSDLPAHKAKSTGELLEELLSMCDEMGSSCRKWADSVWQARQQLALRTLLSLRHLKGQYSPKTINGACKQAMEIGSVHYHTVKILCESKPDPVLDLLEEHEIIRDLKYFQKIIDNQEANDDPAT
jgi:transposase